ncbi:MAG: SPFH domain-containing protein [Opitutaceae bacterium]|jgi:membrane protease subunit (stomatin/prohibitin family)|nr:SPFH domain-containing protein [Opitutaceae bacterium]
MELYSVIKNDGPGGLLFWKFTGEDFRTGSQLIVAENEEALFVKDGVIVESFSGGKFDLRTNNYPFIDKIRSFFSGGVSAFGCKVYFINKAHALELYWGTDSPVQMRDPVYQIMTQVQGRGSYTVKVVDSKKFVLKFVANNIQAASNDAIVAQFRTVFNQKIKTAITRGIREGGREILGVCERLDEFAELLRPIMAPVMGEYGLEIVNFYIGALDIPQDDPGRLKLEMAFGNKAELGVLGQDWTRIQGRDILLATAQNPGAAGTAAGMGMGLGVGMAAGGAANLMAGAVFAPLTPQQPPAPQPAAVSRFAPKTAAADGVECPACHKKSPAGAKFCGECGAKLSVEKAFCTSCGKELAPGAKFCGDCGAKQG